MVCDAVILTEYWHNIDNGPIDVVRKSRDNDYGIQTNKQTHKNNDPKEDIAY